MTKPIALSMGEPSGIGPDLIVEIWSSKSHDQLPDLLVFGCSETLRQRADKLGKQISIANVPLDDLTSRHNTGLLSVVDIPTAVPNCCGELQGQNSKAVVSWISEAVSAVMSGQCRAIVTNPIHNKNLYDAGFEYPGHTEYLGALCEKHTGTYHTPVMMIASDEIRTVPLTIHIPLADVPAQITDSLIKYTVRICNTELHQRFHIQNPRIAVSGLNPHAGEDGSMGTQDRDIIAPALAELAEEGVNVVGPLPADTMFHSRARATYDVAICMYHDQALIPAKTLAFDEGVNVTLGLPIVRTSPDHGTALDIAGTGIARPDSLLAAIKLADTLSSKGAPS